MGSIRLVGLLAGAAFNPAAEAQSEVTSRYIVVFAGSETPEGFEIGGSNLLNLNAALAAVTAAGGTVTSDLTRQIGMAIVSSAHERFADVLGTNPLVEEVNEDVGFAVANESATPVDALGAPAPGEDPLEFQQWGMRAIHATDAHARQSGSPAVDVAVLDSGIDATHLDFVGTDGTNVDIARARSFVRDAEGNKEEDALALVGITSAQVIGPTVPGPYYLFSHGTAVAGVIGARKNGLGIVGVAPDVTLIPIRVFDLNGNTFLSYLLEALCYAGDIQADVINMSFHLNHRINPTAEDVWCRSDREQRAELKQLERAFRYARKRGALPVAVTGNESLDLSADGDCHYPPAEIPGVIAVGATRRNGTLTNYSSYGLGVVDLVAPAGQYLSKEGCSQTLTTDASNTYICGSGTSLAAPHVSGVAALIISQFGTLGPDGDMKMPVDAVEDILYRSSVDIGTEGEDLCYGLGRVDARRAVMRDTNYLRDAAVASCLRYPPPPASSCPGPQITDVEGDAILLEPLVGALTDGDGLDVTRAAFAADGTHLQITLTLADLGDVPPSTGNLWAVFFSDSNGERYSAIAEALGDPATVTYTLRHTEEGDPQADEDIGSQCTPVDGITTCKSIQDGSSFNEVPDSIVFNVPLEDIGIGTQPDGARLSRVVAVSYTTIAGVGANSPGGDDRAPDTGYGADYTVGQVCVPSPPQ